ncbi:MAG: molybdopterin molybdenumtransferase MoeA [Phycisphaerae bacterium]
MRELLPRLSPVSTEEVDHGSATGRVLGEPLRADRDSPPSSVSAMDGYACRLSDVASGRVPVAGEARIGEPPAELPPGAALRIFTGGCVPLGAEAVIRREDVDETVNPIVIRDPAAVRPGENIRRQGENLRAGQEVIPAGTLMHAPAAAALATFGCCRPVVYRRVRLGVLVTGDELAVVADQPPPWRIRDSNGPALAAMFGATPWIEVAATARCVDDLPGLTAALCRLLEDCDAVFLTGGVSRGDHDHVPAAVAAAGGSVVFHRLPIRPGRPILGALGPAGQAILGLPGNPVSVMVTARRFGVPVLRRLAGCAQAEEPPALVRVEGPPRRAADVWWCQPV